MTVKDFIEWAGTMQFQENKIMLEKGKEYTVSSSDKFKNFKSIGERINLNAETVALVYLLKHMDSIRNYVLHGRESSDEDIIGRIHDARNYLLLLGGIIEETRQTNEKFSEAIVDLFDGEAPSEKKV